MPFRPCLSIFALACLAAPAVLAGAAEAAAKKCLYVSSYHRGYDHSDEIEKGVRSVLDGQCEIRQFDMDTKRRKSEEQIVASAQAAKRIIETWRPDIVITSDDHAAKYLIKPYYRNHRIPFVFSGLNWTAKEYGLPYENATGIIEVAPVMPMLRRAQKIVPSLKRAFYVGANVLSEEKNLKRYQRAARQLGFSLDFALVGSTGEWVKAYKRAQDYDLVIVGSRYGVKDWDHDKAVAGILQSTRRLSLTVHDWMMPYTILGMTKVSREQGEWAAKTALRILDGMSPGSIPIVPNRQRDVWINEKILAVAGMTLPDDLMRKGKRLARVAE